MRFTATDAHSWPHPALPCNAMTVGDVPGHSTTWMARPSHVTTWDRSVGIEGTVLVSSESSSGIVRSFECRDAAGHGEGKVEVRRPPGHLLAKPDLPGGAPSDGPLVGRRLGVDVRVDVEREIEDDARLRNIATALVSVEPRSRWVQVLWWSTS